MSKKQNRGGILGFGILSRDGPMRASSEGTFAKEQFHVFENWGGHATYYGKFNTEEDVIEYVKKMKLEHVMIIDGKFATKLEEKVRKI